jgi:hypothetical protein
MRGRPVRAGLRAATLSLLGLVLLAPRPAAAQGNAPDRLEEELRRTDEVLEQAAALVRESDSARARELLEQARGIQAAARGHYRGERYLLAGKLTLEARALAGRAATLAREDASLLERAQREMDRASRELARAREQVGPSSSSARLLEEADALLDRARATFGERHYQAALRLAVAAQRLAGQAVALDGGQGWRLARELERTDHALERVEPLVAASGREEVARLLDQAREMQGRAWEAFRSGRSREALALTREARALANRLRGSLGAADDPTAVEDALRETQVILERAGEEIRPSGDAAAIGLLERAADHQARARAALERGDVRRALAQTRVARSLAKRALQLIGGGES